MTSPATAFAVSPKSQQAIAAFDRALLSPRLSHSDYVRGWMRKVCCVGVSPEGRVRLTVQDKFYRDLIDDYFRTDIQTSLSAELGMEVEVEWATDESLRSRAPEAPEPPPVQLRSLDRNRLDERFTFDSFVPAPSNQLAHAGARAVADQPGNVFNPLFIYGGTGLGKTHLLQALGNTLLAKDPARRVVYLSSEEFTNAFIVAVRDQRMPEFRRRFRDECDCLLVDDIQFLGTKEMTQEEFFHTFNALQSLRKPVAITSDTLPQEIVGLADRLKSRFSSGLIADIQEPSFETRMAILKKKAEQSGVSLPDDVAEYIARVVQRNVRELQSALTRVSAIHSLTGQPLTRELAEATLRDVLPAPRALDVEEIQREAAKFYKLSVDELRGPRRTKTLVHARQVAMHLARSLTQASFPEIGLAFRRDHSTVMTSCDKVERTLIGNLQLKKEVDELTGRLSR